MGLRAPKNEDPLNLLYSDLNWPLFKDIQKNLLIREHIIKFICRGIKKTYHQGYFSCCKTPYGSRLKFPREIGENLMIIL